VKMKTLVIKDHWGQFPYHVRIMDRPEDLVPAKVLTKEIEPILNVLGNLGDAKVMRDVLNILGRW